MSHKFHVQRLIYCFFSIFLFNIVSADIGPSLVLQDRLKRIEKFYVHFIQKIHTDNGDIVEIARGELWVNRPNLFHWHVIYPEESFLISDGKTLWFYVPNIKQVTAYSLRDNITNNVFLKLFVSHNVSEWNNYNVFQKENWFYLKPVICDLNKHVEYQIKITANGIIDQFSVIEKDRKHVDYYLFGYSLKAVDMKKFRFVVSSDIQLDDQRNNS